MSQQLPTDGVRLVAEGVDQFIKGMRQAGLTWDETVNRFRDAQGRFVGVSHGADQLGQSLGNVGAKASATGMQFAGFVTGLNQSMQVIGQITGVIKGLVDGIVNLAKETAPLEGISAQFSILTQNVEGGTQGMLMALQAGASGMIPIRDLMKQYNSAAALVNDQFANNLPQALRLLGKVSAATGEDMNYLLDSLVRGVGRVSPMVIDNLKIQVSETEAAARAAEMYGKKTEALTKLEKQTALNTLVMEKLEEKFGALPDIGGTTTAQFAMLSANMQNLTDIFGQALLPAVNTVLVSLNGMLGAITQLVSEGGALEPWLIGLGTLLSLAADSFQFWADMAIQGIESMTSEASTSIFSTIEQALTWGVELVAAFATGMAQAASDVLIGALNFIGSILEDWLLGASPPKIAPGIEQWGIATFEKYLEGMTKADFGILGDLQKTFKKILSGPEFANISQELAAALAADDKGAIQAIIQQSAGVFGGALSKMVDLQFGLADATEAVTKAEKDLEAQRSKLLDQQNKVNTEIVKYNRLLRAGADEATLAAQLARIQAAEQEAAATEEQATAQEAALTASKARVEQVKEDIDLQKQLIDQLLGINEALTVAEEKDKTEKEKKGKEKPEEAEVIPGVGGALGTRIGLAIDAMKEKLKEKFKDIMQPLLDAWAEVEMRVGNVALAWENFKTRVGNVWEDLKTRFPVLQDIENVIARLRDTVPDLANKLGGRFLQMVIAVWNAFKDPEGGGLWGALTAVWEYLQDSYGIIMESDAAKAIREFIDKLLTPWKEGIDLVNTALANLFDKLSKLAAVAISTPGLEKLMELLGPLISHSPAPLAEGLAQINAQLGQFSSKLALPAAVGMGMRPALASGIGGAAMQSNTTSIDRGVSVEFTGPIYVGNEQEWNVFKAKVVRVIQSGVQTG